jgi:hypothetical protein
MSNVPEKKSYKTPQLMRCGSMTEKTLVATYCQCTNPITIPGQEGQWCYVGDCIEKVS